MDSTIEVATAVVTWAATGLLRWFAPELWRALDKRQLRIVVVALVATGVSVAHGVHQGLGWFAIAKLAVSALSGSVLIRQFTKRTKVSLGDLQLSRDLSIRTSLDQ